MRENIKLADSAQDPGSNRLFFTAGTLFLTWIIAYIDRNVITLLVPSIKKSLLLTDTEIGVLQGVAFALFFSLAGLPIGRLVDRANRRNIIVIGLVLWSLATMSCGLATNFWHLFLSRVCVGVGEACLAPASMSIIADLARPDQRGRVAAFVASGSSVGTASGSYIAGFLLVWLAGTTLALPFLGTIEPWGIVYLLVGLLGLVVGPLLLMIPEPRRRQVAAVRQTLASPFRHMMQRGRLFGPLYACVAFNLITTASVAVWAPVLLMRDFGLSPASTGLVVGTILLVGGPAAAVAAGFLSDISLKRRPHDGRIVVFAGLAVPMILSLLLLTGPKILGLTVTGLIGVKLFSNAISGLGYSTIQDIVPNEMRGVAVAVFVAISNIIGLALGAVLVGIAVDYLYGDEMKLRSALALVTIPSTTLALMAGLLAIRPYRKELAHLLGQAD